MTATLGNGTLVNTNLETGIRYGIISANSVCPYVIEEIQSRGRDVHHEENREEFYTAVNRVCREYVGSHEANDIADYAVEKLSGDYYDDEPVHEFSIMSAGYGPVTGRTTWLGGALLVWIFHSPFQTKAKLCSPCVPNCGDLDNLDPDGVTCYDVPSDWRELP